jgi:tripartite-type tricarboxylate transporter receptor subunit TctC
VAVVTTFVRRTLAAAALTSLLASGATAQTGVADFYKGKTVTIVIGTSPGGGYDLYARLIGRHLGKHIPGNPTIVAANRPGAASNVAAAHIYNVAPKDGTVIGAIFMGAVVDPLFSGRSRATHDPSRFNYIGNANSDVYVCFVRSDAPVKKFTDALATELVMAASSPGGSTYDFPAFLNNVLGTKFKVVSGYPGSREITMAIEKGEAQGGCGNTWSSNAVHHREWFATGFLKVLVQEDSHGHPDLNKAGVPLVAAFATTPEQRRILDLFYSQTAFGRPYVVAPEVPQDRIAALRKAFMDTLRDPELLAEARAMQLDIAPTPGEELQTLVQKIYSAPPDVVQQVRQALAPAP